jgi:hypothetical protein
MRKVIFASGVVALIILALLGTSVGLAISLSAGSQAYVDETVATLAKDGWHDEAFADRSTPELISSAKPGQLSEILAMCRRLGTMTQYGGATGGVTLSVKWETGIRLSAAYVVQAIFERGVATFRILLLRRSGKWMIHGFHVNVAPVGQKGPPEHGV